MVKAHWETAALRVGVIVAAVGLLLTGCTKGSTGIQPLPGASRDTTPSRSPVAEAAGALAAYRAMWGDLAAAAKSSDASHPGLGTHASGAALQLLRHMMTKDREKDVVTKGRLRVYPSVEDSGPAKVVIRDCADAADWLHYTTDGKLENAVPGGHHRIDATVLQRGDRWRVDQLYIGQVGSC
ncbi:hypothetical protein AB0J25_28440 [Streptomyces sp. NPDC049910]|uniref:hypothetical protein n=1 Tax=Streptomyces sp. NPDC049910 TaxID=3155278 RepID=UPI00342BBDFD